MNAVRVQILPGIRPRLKPQPRVAWWYTCAKGRTVVRCVHTGSGVREPGGELENRGGKGVQACVREIPDRQYAGAR